MKTHLGTRVINRLTILSAVALGAFALVPMTASAQSPTDQQYSTTLDFISSGGNVGSGGGPGGTATTTDVGGLPFTGLDVALLAAVAVGLLLAGLMLRRARPSQTTQG